MRIAVLSGKGGTGKTLVSVNLAAVKQPSLYLDCDVEEPNGQLFFQPSEESRKTVVVPMPSVDPALCTGCKTCVHFCRFHALAYAGNRLMIFPDLCHACGGCSLLCPQKALREEKREVGVIRRGRSGPVEVLTGEMRPGEASGTPVLRRLLESAKPAKDVLTVLDCPPGSGCLVMECVRSADYCLLVAEPTLYGTHNLGMVLELSRLFGKPCGVVVNKALDMDSPLEAYCHEHKVKILGRIPYDGELALSNAQGSLAAREKVTYAQLFAGLLDTVETEARHETAACS